MKCVGLGFEADWIGQLLAKLMEHYAGATQRERLDALWARVQASPTYNVS